VSELGWKKKLIEVALPLDAINSDSAREKLDSPEGDDVVLDVEAGSCLHQMVGELTVVRGSTATPCAWSPRPGSPSCRS